MEYLEGTWLGHREKFVWFWVNKHMHLGNTSTCRVESAHNQLKTWLRTSTGGMVTIWEAAHKNIESQIMAIK